MKRIYACLCIVAVLLGVAFYSSWRVQKFAEDISDDIDNAMEAIRDEDLPSARQALAEGAELCDKMREGMNHLLRTQDFTELEAALRAADGHLDPHIHKSLIQFFHKSTTFYNGNQTYFHQIKSVQKSD